MTSHALLHIASELERLAEITEDVPEFLRDLAKYARSEAGQVPNEAAAPAVLERIDIRRVCRGDVLAKRWSEETIPQHDALYQVVRTHRRGKKVSVVDIDGNQLTLPLCEFTHRWPKEAARKLHIPWRFDFSR